MAERATITQITQLGLEVTPGVAVAATKRLLGLDFSLGPNFTNTTIRPNGYKVKTRVVPGREYTDATANGTAAVFNDMPYLLSSAVKQVTPTRIIPSTGLAYRWSYSPTDNAQDTKQTYTAEHGSSVRASQVTGLQFTDFDLKWDRNTIAMTAKAIGQRLVDGFTLTSGGVSEVPLVPLIPGNTDVYLDTTAAGLGTTKLLRAFTGEFNLGEHVKGVWPLDSSKTSYAATVEDELPVMLKLLAEADAAGMALLDTMRAGDTRFIRVTFTGPLIETGTPNNYYAVTLDVAGEVSAPSLFQDHEGVYAIEWTFTGVHDETWGKAFNIDVVNTLATL